jgi:hypothetical protein
MIDYKLFRNDHSLTPFARGTASEKLRRCRAIAEPF